MDNTAYNNVATNPGFVVAQQYLSANLASQIDMVDRLYQFPKHEFDKSSTEARKARFTPRSSGSIGKKFVGFIMEKKLKKINQVMDDIKEIQDRQANPMGDEFYQAALSISCQKLVKTLNVETAKLGRMVGLYNKLNGSARPIKLGKVESMQKKNKEIEEWLDRYNLERKQDSVDVASVKKDDLSSVVEDTFGDTSTALNLPKNSDIIAGAVPEDKPQFPRGLEEEDISTLPHLPESQTIDELPYQNKEDDILALPDKQAMNRESGRSLDDYSIDNSFFQGDIVENMGHYESLNLPSSEDTNFEVDPNAVTGVLDQIAATFSQIGTSSKSREELQVIREQLLACTNQTNSLRGDLAQKKQEEINAEQARAATAQKRQEMINRYEEQRLKELKNSIAALQQFNVGLKTKIKDSEQKTADYTSQAQENLNQAEQIAAMLKQEMPIAVSENKGARGRGRAA